MLNPNASKIQTNFEGIRDKKKLKKPKQKPNSPRIIETINGDDETSIDDDDDDDDDGTLEYERDINGNNFSNFLWDF